LWDINSFVWNKYAIVAIVSNDKNGKEELWLIMTSNKALLPFFYYKMPAKCKNVQKMDIC
jgi:hypothetical protein